MKNVHLLPTDKLIKSAGDLVRDKYGSIHIFTKNDGKEYGKTTTKLNIYITSDEEIKEGDWVIDKNGLLAKVITELTWHFINSKKIILTTDQDLINDGVQPIEDYFLEWFVKNSSCEFVEVDKNWNYPLDNRWEYKIIIPQEELNPCKDIIINDKATIDVPFHNRHIRFENLTSEQANYLIQVSEFYQLSGTRRSAEVSQEELKHPKVFSENGNELFFDEQGNLLREEPDYEKIKQALVEMRKLPMTFVPDERMYSEEDLREAFKAGEDSKEDEINGDGETSFNEWFDQYKKK